MPQYIEIKHFICILTRIKGILQTLIYTTPIYIYIYIYMSVCLCVCLSWNNFVHLEIHFQLKHTFPYTSLSSVYITCVALFSQQRCNDRTLFKPEAHSFATILKSLKQIFLCYINDLVHTHSKQLIVYNSAKKSYFIFSFKVIPFYWINPHSCVRMRVISKT